MSFSSKESCLLDLKENYTNPKSPIFCSGLTSIFNYYKGKLRLAEIKNFLASVESYTLHREYKNLKRNPSYSHFRRFQFQMDLIDIQGLAEWNDGVKHIVTVIDTFTRKAWAKAIVNKTSHEVLSAFKNILSQAGDPPVTLVTDKGLEMRNKSFINFCKTRKINFFHNDTSSHASYIERFNRTLQNLIYKYLTEFETKRYIDKLSFFMESYNNRIHRIIKITPEEAELEENHEKVALEVSRSYSKVKRENPKFSVGQLVRLALQKKTFHRGYEEQSNYEVFNIYKVKKHMPKPLYFLETYDKKDKLAGGFYAHEITPVNSDIFKVEKVIKSRRVRGKLQHLVKWKGYGEEHNSWIDDSDVTRRF